MRYFLSSIKTISYWKYALFSKDAIVHFFAAIGALYTVVEILDFFSIYTRDKYGRYAILVFFILALVFVLATRRPISRVTYKVPKRDFAIEVRIGDLFACPGGRIISSNTTFDTNIAEGIISPNSLQGQFTSRFFQKNISALDDEIERALAKEEYVEVANKPGKLKKYPIGTVAHIRVGNEDYYWLAMANINEHGNAISDIKTIDLALEKLWRFIADRGELGDVIVPLLGTGRGRVDVPRKKLIEKVAQSFADASKDKVFANRLVIVVHPSDAANFEVNLFEVKDYLRQSLHI
jgi:hypothetical protein